MLAPKAYDFRNLVQEQDDNLGGVEACWYTEAANLLNFPASADELIITDDLELKAGANWFQLVSVRDSVRYKQTPKDLNRHGQSYTQQLTGTLARHSAGLASGLESLERQELVLLYRDRNGEVQLVGTPEQPLSWKDAYDAGTLSNRNNYDWTLAAETPRRARPYLGRWTVSDVVFQGVGGLVEIRDRRGRLMATAQRGQTVIVRSGFRVAFTIT